MQHIYNMITMIHMMTTLLQTPITSILIMNILISLII